MKLNTISLVMLSLVTAVTVTTNTFAATDECKPINTVLQDKTPPGVCVFDIDDTLAYTTKGEDGHTIKDKQGRKLLHPYGQAQKAIDACLANGFGIAIATAEWVYRPLQANDVVDDPDLAKYGPKMNLDFGEYDTRQCNHVEGTGSGIRDTNPSVNPIYISKTLGEKYDTRLYRPVNKAYAMERLMRTYYGFGAGGRFADKTNTYLTAYQKKHGSDSMLTHSEKKDITSCMVLFDDDPKNVSEIAKYNKDYDLDFRAVLVDPGMVNPKAPDAKKPSIPLVDVKMPRVEPMRVGVTAEDVEKAIQNMPAHCKVK